jgi:hypothetical protein
VFEIGSSLREARERQKLELSRIGDGLEAIPLKLEFAHTRLAEGEDAAWIRRRFVEACAKLGTDVRDEDGRLVARWC